MNQISNSKIYTDIVLKFTYKEDDDNNILIFKFSALHGAKITTKFNQLKDYLKLFQNNVKINKVLILENENGHVWVEEKLLKFRKFPLKKRDLIDQIVTSENKTLRDLQRFIFNQTEHKHTICDLQGDIVGDNIILTDIEFTDTMAELGWSCESLNDRFEYFLMNDYNQLDFDSES